jgi:hypothetical protein
MASTSGRMKLGKGSLTIDGKPVAEITDIRVPSKGPAFSTHCLRRKQVPVVPHAVFRRWANESTSYNVILPHLEHMDALRAQEAFAALQRVSDARNANDAARRGV